MIYRYFKGIGIIVLVILLVMAAALFYFVYDLAYVAAVLVLVIVGILIFPYFLGRKDKKAKKGSYRLKKIK